MIKLKINKPGYTIAIPGVKPFRSPVEIDVSNLDIRVVAMYLKANGINDYELEATTKKGGTEVYTPKDFDKLPTPEKKEKGVESRLSNLEKRLDKMMSLLVHRDDSVKSKNEEQITDKLEKIEEIMGQILVSKSSSAVPVSSEEKEPEIEEFDAFIPDIDTSDLMIKSKEHKVIKQDNHDLDNSADALSILTRGKK